MPASSNQGARQAITYKFRVTTALPERAIAEGKLANELRNDLTECEHGYQEAKERAWEGRPDVAEANRAVGQAEDAVEQAEKACSAQRRATGRKLAEGPEAKALTAARKELRLAKAARRELKKHEYQNALPLIQEAAQARDARIKELYGIYRDKGLYWSTVNDIIARHRTSAKEAAKRRAENRRAGVRYKRWTGEFTLAVQLQRESEDPERTAGALASGTAKWRTQVRIPSLPDEFAALPRAQRRALARQGRLSMRIGSAAQAETIELGVNMHRQVRPDADIAMVRLTTRRVGPDSVAHITMPAFIPAVPPRTGGAVVAVHLGWRVLPGDSIRVAVVSDGTSGEPAGLGDGKLAEVVQRHAGHSSVCFPAGWRREHDEINAWHGDRDRALGKIRSQLADFLAPLGAGPWDGAPSSAQVAVWSSPQRFASLAGWLEQHRDDTGLVSSHREVQEMVSALIAWRDADTPAWRKEAWARHRLNGRREDAWRKVAAWIVAGARVVVVDSWDIPSLARVPRGEEDTEQARAARANRALASPGALRQFVEQAARLAGARVIEAEVEGQAHIACGQELDADQRRAGALVWCGACGEEVDQDVNMLALMKRAALEGPELDRG